MFYQSGTSSSKLRFYLHLELLARSYSNLILILTGFNFFFMAEEISSICFKLVSNLQRFLYDFRDF